MRVKRLMRPSLRDGTLLCNVLTIQRINELAYFARNLPPPFPK